MNRQMDINFMAELWFGMFASMIILFNFCWWTMIIWNRLISVAHHRHSMESRDSLVEVIFDDGSTIMIDPTDPDQVAAVRAVHQESSQHIGDETVDAFYSPNSGGMPAKDISEYDWKQEDYETKTAGPVRDDLYD